MNTEVRPLICIPSPRDIVQVKEAIDKISEDKLWVKYMTEPYAYKALRDYFLEHKEYTHIVIWPDDLVVPVETFAILKSDVEAEVPPFPVIAGICNLSWKEQDRYAVCEKLNVYNFFTEEKLEEFRKLDAFIIPVEWEGFACTWIRRDVVEQIEFKPQALGVAMDWAFYAELSKKNIQVYIDIRAKSIHLAKRADAGPLWGYHAPHLRFDGEYARLARDNSSRGIDGEKTRTKTKSECIRDLPGTTEQIRMDKSKD